MPGEFTCSKCGARAHSKCPNERTVFPDNQVAAVLSNLIKFPGTTVEDGRGKVQLQISIGIFPDPGTESMTPEEHAEYEALRIIQTSEDDTLRQLVCVHNWTLPKGQKCSFGHAHN